MDTPTEIAKALKAKRDLNMTGGMVIAPTLFLWNMLWIVIIYQRQ